MPGGGDPDNRRDFPGGWKEDLRNAFEAGGRTREEQEIFSHVQKLLALRAANPELRAWHTETLVATEQTLVYRRGPMVVAINNDTTAATVRLPGRALGPDLLGFCQASQNVVVIPARTGCIFRAP
jgi:hypothetical protein